MTTVSLIPIDALTPSEINPREIKDFRFERLKRSLSSPDGKNFFNLRPCLVNDRGGKLVIYAGNMRYRAARALGWEKIPCVIEKISLDVEKERTIKDNVQQGEWDIDFLTSHYETSDLREWGFDPAEVAYSEPQEEPKKKRTMTCPSCGNEF